VDLDVETDSVRGDQPGRWIAPAGLSYAAPYANSGQANDDQMTLISRSVSSVR
jgi:hypothetical protein